MSDIFNLVGKVVIEGIDDAKKKLNNLGEEGEKSSGKLSSALSKVGDVAKTMAKAVAVGVGATATAISVVGKQSLNAYADYEQLVGGVETLFKDSADKLMEYASQSYIAQGLSANEYMETATSFSASLLQGLEGDTEKAVEYTNRAITDMSDNANKMGTDISSIQNAYQGFAKQNYTMLDNLKLGYGGTKEEMARLIEDASKMTDVQKELGVSVDKNSLSFDNIVNAIHVMQTSMDITGTTSKEALGTISGSVNMLKGAWQNLLVGLSDDSQDFEVLMDNVATSLVAVVSNVMPRIQIIFKKLPTLVKGLTPQLTQMVGELLPPLLESATALLQGIAEALPSLLGTITSTLISLFPQLLELFTTLMGVLVGALPSLAEMILSALPTLLPQIITALVSLTLMLIQNLSEVIQILIDNLPSIIESILTALLENLPMIIQGLLTLVGMIVVQIPLILDGILTGVINFVSSLINKVIEFLTPIGQWIFTNVIQPIINYVTNLNTKLAEIWDNIKAKVSETWENIKTNIAEVWDNIKTNVVEKVTSIKDKIKEKFGEAKDNVVEIFTNIKDKIQEKIENARDKVSEAIEKIKSFFKFEWSLPKLKMPHISISGSFSLIPPSAPSFSISWYKNGGILNDPTIFGVGKNGTLLGGGESGAEAVAPLDTLMDYVRIAVDESNNELAERMNGILSILSDYLPQFANRQLVLDTGAIVGAISNDMDSELGTIKRRKDRQ